MAPKEAHPGRGLSARYAGAGIHFAATLGVFAAVGYWADGKLSTRPWLLLLGVFLGFGLGLRSLVARLGPRRSQGHKGTGQQGTRGGP